VAGLLIALATGGCSVTMPIGSLAGDDEVTGSTDARPAPILSSKFDAEDTRRAHAALAIAVDPQGNGAPVSWDNPVSGKKGSFVAAGPLYVVDDRVCRSFIAQLTLASDTSQLQGSTCRTGPNEWFLREVKPWLKPG